MPPRSHIAPRPTPPSLTLLATPEQVAAAQARLRVAGAKLHLVTDRFEPAVDALPNLERLPTLAPELRVPILDALTAEGVNVPTEVWSYLGVSYAERHPVVPPPPLPTSPTDAPVTILDLARSPEERAVLAELRPTYRGVALLIAEMRYHHNVVLTSDVVKEILGSLARRGLCAIEPIQRLQWCLTSPEEVDGAVMARAKNLRSFLEGPLVSTLSAKFTADEMQLVRQVVGKEHFDVLLTWDERVAIHKLFDRAFPPDRLDSAGATPPVAPDPVPAPEPTADVFAHTIALTPADLVDNYIEHGSGHAATAIRAASTVRLLHLAVTLPVMIHELRGAGRLQAIRSGRMQDVFNRAVAALAVLLDLRTPTL